MTRGALCLLADSRLLIHPTTGPSALPPALAALLPDGARAVYLGASNGDEPMYYSIFEAAMDRVGVRDCRMISSAYTPADRASLARADLVLLAGGDVARGYDVFVATEMAAAIEARHRAGALCVGVSAGAVQLGLTGWREPDGTPFAALGLVPWIIDVHDEANGWQRLKDRVRAHGPPARGLGIPFGSALLCAPGHPAVCFGRAPTTFAQAGGDVVESELR